MVHGFQSIATVATRLQMFTQLSSKKLPVVEPFPPSKSEKTFEFVRNVETPKSWTEGVGDGSDAKERI